jgi:ketosteroid isomerase-like protein
LINHNRIKKAIIITILAVATVSIKINCQKDRKVYDQNLQSLVDSERSFAKLSADTGMASAFTYWLADEAIVFRPEPVRGKERYASSPDVPGMLIWQPEFADVSKAGDLGYTSGPYEFRREGAAHPADGYGHYVSIWKRREDDSWRVLIDAGISHTAPDYQLADTVMLVSNPEPTCFTSSSPDTTLLHQLDQAFSDSARVTGYYQALENFASAAVRIYRENYFPFFGIPGVKTKIDGPLIWNPLSSESAASDDLGYSYGIARRNPEKSESENSSYLRIWKREADDTWKLVLEITNPIPK